ncbi:MAG: hypothetical protein IPI67_36170 [Myxococcales bacterium]|nr:hypothetical protein [Myxococcales bacterium]
MRRRLVALFAGCVAHSLAAPAWADDEKAAAREIFRAAEAAFSRGEYRAAALAFEAADERSPNGGAAYNAARAWEKAGDEPRAADAFERALRSGELVDARLADAQKRLAALSPRLGVLVIDGPPKARVSVGSLEDAPAPRRLHLTPGEYPVHVRWASGKRQTHQVRVSAGREQTLGLGGAEAVVRDAPHPVEHEQPLREHRTSADEGRAGSGPWGWLLLSAGALSMGTGAVLLNRGLSARDEFEASGRTDAGAHDRALGYRTWSSVTLFGGGALVGAGVAVLLVSPRPSEPTSESARWSLEIAPTGARLVARHW